MKLFLKLDNFIYKNIVRRIIFLFNSEMIHEFLLGIGERMGKISFLRSFLRILFLDKNTLLSQEISGVKFANPIGLAAGFDYKAQLTQTLSSIGFAFGTVGTITYYPYGGNPKPMLARLVKSKSLMVNKGFKNQGIVTVLKKLKKNKFDVPVGLSIGKTNTRKKMTQSEAVEEIVKTFRLAERSKINFRYYELNISCPNLYGDISFYPPKNLDQLLREVFKLKLKKPLFIKMPIEKTDKETEAMLKVIAEYSVRGVIFGNLQKDRKNPLLDKDEIKKFKMGNFSGKPTEKRSNELIALAFKKYGNKLTIIGCGGVFTAEDAYKKIKLGASLVQLVTGLIFEGPLLPSKINFELEELVKKDGYKNISQAVGVEALQ